ncbi:CD276 antigen-like isoform 2-T2 [Anableps anableps]
MTVEMKGDIPPLQIQLFSPQHMTNIRMSGNNVSVFLVLVSLLWTTLRVKAETEISCVFMQSCILPCSFQGGSDVIIHWFQLEAAPLHVHSYYVSRDQRGHQNQNFRGRTSLFKDQISSGNASLLLRGVKVEDQSRYRCHCSTVGGNQESFIQLEVDASAVSISQEGDRISCSSEGIYPQPELSWSTIPPSSSALNESTSIQQAEDQLYSISSSLRVSDGGSGLSYSCTVRTRSNRKRATFKQLRVILSSRRSFLSCSDSNVSATNLLWKFNHSQMIVNQTSQSRVVSEAWKRHVKDVSESGGLSLQDLSPQQEGIYTCEFRKEGETYVTSSFLKTEEDRGGTKRHSGGSIAVVAAAGIVGVVLVICARKKKGSQL